MKILITGGAGFIGSNLVNVLIKKDKVVVIDNMILGKKEFIQSAIDGGRVEFYEQDLLDFPKTLEVFEKHKFDLVFHMSANSDISYGTKNTDWDLKQETLVTYNVLESMRRTGVQKIVFASTSAIYGEAPVKPIAEDYGPLLPISFYGAGKLASEGLITAFCHNYDLQAWLFRFANIVGRNGTHGVLVDFIKKLRANPKVLEVLGDGRQAKPYLHVDDCVAGMLFGYTNSREKVNYYNLACEGATPVAKIAELVIAAMKLENVAIHYTGGARGWAGDVPQVRLDADKLARLGWKASMSSDEAVNRAINDLLKQ
ncbi:MAG: NAD-dependent epimerase/dehydratase family protein [Candidatus Doudnabacteria bacterium]|nr:NAD-dependent epimerase/dehydratase family protein [Candidatus Doudnabacteria bacterium]